MKPLTAILITLSLFSCDFQSAPTEIAKDRIALESTREKEATARMEAVTRSGVETMKAATQANTEAVKGLTALVTQQSGEKWLAAFIALSFFTTAIIAFIAVLAIRGKNTVIIYPDKTESKQAEITLQAKAEPVLWGILHELHRNQDHKLLTHNS